MDLHAKQLIRRVILERLAAVGESTPDDDERSPVILDQQSMGRLSRMDAIQRQAMAKETARRRKAEMRRLREALSRLDDEEFGHCANCGEEIPLRRLEIDPAATICVACANGS